MNVTTALSKISYALRGTDDDAPTFGDDEAVYWLSVLNDKKDELFKDTKKKWTTSFKLVAPNEPGTVATVGTTALTGTSTHFTDYRVGDKITVDGETVRTIATIPSDTSLTVTVAFSNTDTSSTFTHTSIIATGVQEYSLHRSLILPSDQVLVTTTADSDRYYDFLHPQERNTTNQRVFIYDDLPKLLGFSAEITSTQDIVGGSLYVPGYYLPDDMTAATDILPFPDDKWGIMATAAEIAFNDIIYEDKADGINAKANALYAQMAQANRSGTWNNPRKVPTNVSRIRDTRVNR